MHDFLRRSPESCRSLCIVLIKVCKGGLEITGSLCEVEGLTRENVCSLWGGWTETCSLLSLDAVVGSRPVFFPPELSVPNVYSNIWFD